MVLSLAHVQMSCPILFLININDLPDSVLSGTRLFADDIVKYNTSDNPQQLQHNLTAIQTWETRRKIEFNPLQCEYIKFSRKRSKWAQHEYKLNNQHSENIWCEKPGSETREFSKMEQR